MKSPSLTAKLVLTAVCAAIFAGTFWMLHHAFSGGTAPDPHVSSATTGSGHASAVDKAAQQAAQDISRRAEERASDYAEVRRRLQSGELTTLPADFAPPPVPTAPPPPAESPH